MWVVLIYWALRGLRRGRDLVGHIAPASGASAWITLKAGAFQADSKPLFCNFGGGQLCAGFQDLNQPCQKAKISPTARLVHLNAGQKIAGPTGSEAKYLQFFTFLYPMASMDCSSSMSSRASIALCARARRTLSGIISKSRVALLENCLISY